MIGKISEPADLILFPEMFSTGFTTNTGTCAESMEGPSLTFLKEVALSTGSLVMGSILIREDQGYYNRLVSVFPDATCQTYDKRHLFRLSEEYKVMNPGDRKIIVGHKGWNILPLVCYDLRFPVWSKNKFRDGEYEYDLLVYPSNWPRSRRHAWKSLLMARAIENQAYVIGVNRIGPDGYGTPHAGDSLVIDPKGNILAEAGEEETILKATISLEELNLFRESFKIGLDWDRFIIEI
jgi:predicted amidohydrolase